MLAEIQNIILENERRNELIKAPVNPVTGEGAMLERKQVYIEDFPILCRVNKLCERV
jgi:hypothetical protein